MRTKPAWIIVLVVFVAVVVSGSWYTVVQKTRADQRHAAEMRKRHVEANSACRLIGIAALTYAATNGDRLPVAEKWEAEVKPYLGTLSIALPPAEDGRPRRFAMNRALSGMKIDRLPQPASTILFYESVSTSPNASDDLTSIPDPHQATSMAIGYADGHCYTYPSAMGPELIKRSGEAMKP